MLFFEMFFGEEVQLNVNIVDNVRGIFFCLFVSWEDLALLRNVQLIDNYFHELFSIVSELNYQFSLLFAAQQLFNPVSAQLADLIFDLFLSADRD